ncbi:hypothetical protein Tco_0011068 [Tanacetum coccineum]
MLAIPHLSQVSSMAEIVSKEAQKKSKAGICFKTYLTQQAHLLLLSPKKHKLQVQEIKTSAINRAFCADTPYPILDDTRIGFRVRFFKCIRYVTPRKIPYWLWPGEILGS